MDQNDHFTYVDCNDAETLEAIISCFSDPPKPIEVGVGNVGTLENTNLKNLLSSPETGNYIPVTIIPLGHYIFQVVAATSYASSVKVGYVYKNGSDVGRWTGWS